ncbi:MAG: hypothetical protein QOF55_2050 [Thermoleophilaceae bacterium]|nr:hypothetical protein [Thermoleophilaceae bacterium]
MSTVSFDALERLAAETSSPRPSRRMLVIVNPYATTVSDRLKNLVVYALRGRYEVDSVDTQAKGHATELCREAAEEGYDVVVALRGDGTVNEAVNGLAGSPTPLTCLPGGRTNVYCRILGIPNDVVDATEHLLRIADAWEPRTLDLARVNDRYFAFSSGVGLDARVVQRVDSHPRLKTRLGEWYFTWAGLSTFGRRYLLRPPSLEADVDGRRTSGVLVIVQKAHPYTYFDRRRIDIADGAELDDSGLAGIVLERAHPIDIPTIVWRAFSSRARIIDHRRVRPFTTLEGLTVRSLTGQPLPVQVDGDYVGETLEARYSVRPGGITVVS